MHLPASLVADQSAFHLQAGIILAIPSIVMKPSLDDIQQVLNKTVQTMLKVCQVKYVFH